MPKYRVLDRRGIEHGTASRENNVIYFPLGTQNIPKKLLSGAHGDLVATDTKGLIELEPEQAAQLADFQVPYLDGKPASVDEENSYSQRQAQEAADKAEAEAAEAQIRQAAQELVAERRAARKKK